MRSKYSLILKRSGNLEKVIDGFPDYTVTDSGEVISYKRGRKPRVLVRDGCGYLRVGLRNDKYITKKVHRLVAEAFIPNPNNFGEVNHKDGNKANNNVANLEWVDRKQNLQHSWDSGLREHHREVLSKLGKDSIYKASNASKKPIEMVDSISGEVLKTFESSYQACRELFPFKKLKYIADKVRCHSLNPKWGILNVNGINVFFRQCEV